ncbi:MAG: hypothetical protein ACM3OC_02705 [Deltaproteobacteria bacterium]
MFKKLISTLIICTLCFQQTGFAQLAVPGAAPVPSADRFRPLHLRYLSLEADSSLRLFLDKGDLSLQSEIDRQSPELLRFFLIGLSLPNSSFWVNLRPDARDNMIDSDLAKTDMGRIMLEADLQLKQDTAHYTSPDTKEGRQYWDRLYKKAEELGLGNTTIPTLARPWIVPGEIIIAETATGAYIYKAQLKVMLEQDYIRDSAYDLKDARLKELNEFASGLMRELVVPAVTREINSSKKYAALRQVYYSLIFAQWFKQRKTGTSSAFSGRVDSRDLTGLGSSSPWNKDTYFNAYRDSFNKGEYNIKENAATASGIKMRTYASGGMNLAITQLDGGRMTEEALAAVTKNPDVIAGIYRTGTGIAPADKTDAPLKYRSNIKMDGGAPVFNAENLPAILSKLRSERKCDLVYGGNEYTAHFTSDFYEGQEIFSVTLVPASGLDNEGKDAKIVLMLADNTQGEKSSLFVKLYDHISTKENPVFLAPVAVQIAASLSASILIKKIYAYDQGQETLAGALKFYGFSLCNEDEAPFPHLVTTESGTLFVLDLEKELAKVPFGLKEKNSGPAVPLTESSFDDIVERLDRQGACAITFQGKQFNVNYYTAPVTKFEQMTLQISYPGSEERSEISLLLFPDSKKEMAGILMGLDTRSVQGVIFKNILVRMAASIAAKSKHAKNFYASDMSDPRAQRMLQTSGFKPYMDGDPYIEGLLDSQNGIIYFLPVDTGLTKRLPLGEMSKDGGNETDILLLSSALKSIAEKQEQLSPEVKSAVLACLKAAIADDAPVMKTLETQKTDITFLSYLEEAYRPTVLNILTKDKVFEKLQTVVADSMTALLARIEKDFELNEPFSYYFWSYHENMESWAYLFRAIYTLLPQEEQDSLMREKIGELKFQSTKKRYAAAMMLGWMGREEALTPLSKTDVNFGIKIAASDPDDNFDYASPIKAAVEGAVYLINKRKDYSMTRFDAVMRALWERRNPRRDVGEVLPGIQEPVVEAISAVLADPAFQASSSLATSDWECSYLNRLLTILEENKLKPSTDLQNSAAELVKTLKNVAFAGLRKIEEDFGTSEEFAYSFYRYHSSMESQADIFKTNYGLLTDAEKKALKEEKLAGLEWTSKKQRYISAMMLGWMEDPATLPALYFAKRDNGFSITVAPSDPDDNYAYAFPMGAAFDTAFESIRDADGTGVSKKITEILEEVYEMVGDKDNRALLKRLREFPGSYAEAIRIIGDSPNGGVSANAKAQFLAKACTKVAKEFSADGGAAKADGGLPGKTGGIDFRALPLSIQPAATQMMQELRQMAPEIADLNAEWSRIEKLAKMGTPSSRRIKEYLAACYQKGELKGRGANVLSCISRIVRDDELASRETDSDLKTMLLLLSI